MSWYLGSMNDGLFIINTPPRPSTDDQFHDRKNGPTLVLNVTDLPIEKAQAIVAAHNLALRALSLESVREEAAEKDALAKRLVAYYAEWAPRMRGDEYEAGDWRWLAIHLRDIAAASITELSPELEERKQAAIRALQHAPARVGEGGATPKEKS